MGPDGPLPSLTVTARGGQRETSGRDEEMVANRPNKEG